MNVILGSDHAGFELKKILIDIVKMLGHTAVDVGALEYDRSDDYPDYAEAVAKAVMEKKGERGIMICGSGVGASIVSNKVPGIRAGICHDTYSAHQGVEHDNMNVLVLGSRIIGVELARDIVKTYLTAKFSNEERHKRRLQKIAEIEKRY
ncbi:MAG: ribose 5-phosphate isomerase [Spirochaetes bacterium DG_61]|jgi:ribose 5-phosphate isomerase B|nr:MAG: ribose 5-phosphate isomerase [Spirochaetes bacterium DG_61]